MWPGLEGVSKFDSQPFNVSAIHTNNSKHEYLQPLNQIHGNVLSSYLLCFMLHLNSQDSLGTVKLLVPISITPQYWIVVQEVILSSLFIYSIVFKKRNKYKEQPFFLYPLHWLDSKIYQTKSSHANTSTIRSVWTSLHVITHMFAYIKQPLVIRSIYFVAK